MATIVNDIDVLLQAATTRILPVTLPPTVLIPAVKALSVKASAGMFLIAANGAATPSSITFTATLAQISGTVSWSVTAGTATLTGISGTTATLTAANMTSTTATIQASVTDSGTTYTATVTVARVVDAATTVRQSTGYVYYALSSATAPATPSATSYNFTTGAFTGLTTNWSPVFTATTPTATTKFWASRYTISEAGLGGTQTITFSAPFNHIRFDGLVTFSNLSVNDGTTTIDGGNIRTGTLSADRISAGTMTSGSSSVKIFQENTLFKAIRGDITSMPGAYIYENDGLASATHLLWVRGGNAATNATALFDSRASGMTTLQGFSYGTSGYAAKFATFNGSTTTTQYEFYACTPSYAAWVPSAKGKVYFQGGTGPFTGFHPALIPIGTYELGDIVVDDEIVRKPDVNNAIGTCMLSSVPNERGVIGVISQVRPLADELEDYTLWMEFMDTHQLLDVNALGEGLINVCGEGGDIAKGDLIVTSSMPGKGMRQADDIVRSYTVAKSREAVTFDTPNQVKQIACIYLCG